VGRAFLYGEIFGSTSKNKKVDIKTNTQLTGKKKDERVRFMRIK
jgi:hypothetical protein